MGARQDGTDYQLPEYAKRISQIPLWMNLLIDIICR
jgi:hypothetical protein